MKPGIKVYEYEKDKMFTLYFDTEFERDKFIEKLRYSKKLLFVKKV